MSKRVTTGFLTIKVTHMKRAVIHSQCKPSSDIAFLSYAPCLASNGEQQLAF